MYSKLSIHSCNCMHCQASGILYGACIAITWIIHAGVYRHTCTQLFDYIIYVRTYISRVFCIVVTGWFEWYIRQCNGNAPISSTFIAISIPILLSKCVYCVCHSQFPWCANETNELIHYLMEDDSSIMYTLCGDGILLAKLSFFSLFFKVYFHFALQSLDALVQMQMPNIQVLCTHQALIDAT